MTPNEKLEKEIAEIIGDLKCSKDFKCKKSGFKNLCKAKVAGTDAQLLVCLEKHPKKCEFFNLAAGYICECPLRIYIAKKLKK
jgi:hypothetical protein